jgi:hypothetical protein
MKSALTVGYDLLPAVLALVYVFGVWRSWKQGKYEQRPILYGLAGIVAAAAVAAMLWTSIELLSGHP